MRILLVVVILFFSASFARAQESAADPRMARVEEWLEAIRHHEPGEFDAAAERMAHWSYGDLQALSVDAVVLSQLMRDLRINFFNLRRPGQKVTQQIRFTPARSSACGSWPARRRASRSNVTVCSERRSCCSTMSCCG